MAYIPEHKIDEVRQAADIVEVISSYVPLARAGNLFKGLCPFHAEKTPSFTVNPEKRIFHCFGCGVGGNVFRFLMMQKGISFAEAVRELADRLSIDLPRVNQAEIRKSRGEKQALMDATAMASAFYKEELNSSAGAEARSYLQGRGLKPELLNEFGLGWAPHGWNNLSNFLQSKKVPPPIMEKAGLIRVRDNGRKMYDTFRSRVITPIFDLDGKPVAFGGRLLVNDDQQPKYLNSPETPIFNKGRILYGLGKNRPAIRAGKSVYIVEGYFDLLSLAAHGIRNTAATLGTALTISHLRLLKGYIDHAILLFDADEAGRAAAARSLPLFMSAELEGRVLSLPEGHDPDSFVRAHGPEALEREAGRAVSLIDFYIEQTLKRYPDTLTGKSRAAREALEIISKIESRTSAELLRNMLAERLGVSEQSLQLSERRQRNTQAEKSGDSPDALVGQVAADFEMELLGLVLSYPETLRELVSVGLGPRLKNQTVKTIFETMALQFDLDGGLDVDRLVEKLQPEDADLLIKIAFTDHGLSSESAGQAVNDYIKKFALIDRRKKSEDLSRRIKQAQKNGDNVGLQRLLEEKNRMLKERTL